ncbi:MAG: CPBP family intramembrane metalloprotease [Myxococcales bacterium]|nr:CPBP family intramembrane metalloprotease [Myxococcales bacterium]
MRASAGAGPSARTGAWPLAVRLATHAAIGGGCLAYAIGFGRPLFVCEPWLPLPSAVLVAASGALGVAVAAANVMATRRAARARWGAALLETLKAPVEGATDATLLLMALAGGVAEELLFRGVLGPALGVVLASALFGLAHQVRGPARWIWAGWAFLLGLALALVFRATGSLLGPVVAHVAINFANLRFVRDARIDARGAHKRLGGLLAPRP